MVAVGYCSCVVEVKPGVRSGGSAVVRCSVHVAAVSSEEGKGGRSMSVVGYINGAGVIIFNLCVYNITGGCQAWRKKTEDAVC